MTVVLRYVDEKWHVIERFIGIEHVACTTALSLKAAIDGLFSRHGLSMSRLRGQGYNEASNMQGEFNGLKTLILKENYVHCFAHQLQLALVAVAKMWIPHVSHRTDTLLGSYPFEPTCLFVETLPGILILPFFPFFRITNKKLFSILLTSSLSFLCDCSAS